MERIKNFNQFSLNETDVQDQQAALLAAAQSIKLANKDADASKNEETTGAAGYADTEAAKNLLSASADSGTIDFNSGDNDFILYMQHQQGVAGAAGLIKAMKGTGKIFPDTIATKKGVKYANLVGNIANANIKREMIDALNKGDQKTAATLFMNHWKAFWNSHYKNAMAAIKKPENSKVADIIRKYCKEYGVDYNFAVAVAYIESGFKPSAGNSTYKGLYAMNPSEKYPGVPNTPLGSNWINPEDNAKAGIGLLKTSIPALKKMIPGEWASLGISKWADNVA
jgi:hypothetical protein